MAIEDKIYKKELVVKQIKDDKAQQIEIKKKEVWEKVVQKNQLREQK